jgi:uncharacterized protein YndB with AHSA1/START domain
MTFPPARAARAIADVSAGLVLASVEIARPPERVFRALAGEEITRWWGSDDLYRVTKWTGDVKKGASWKSEGQGRDGKPFSVSGEFLEVDPPNKLVHTWRYDWDPSGSVTTITFLLEPIDGGKRTRVLVRHEGFKDPAACSDHASGWERVLTWLTDHLDKETLG